MSDYLPPIVTKLDGDISPLAAKLAEAEKLVDEYGKNVEKTTKDHGEAAGEAGGKGLTEKLEAELDKPTVAEKPLSRMADRVREKFQELGEQSGKDMAMAIEEETKNLEARLTHLADDFVASGDFDVFKQYKQTQGDLGLLRKVRTEFDAIKGEAEKVGIDVGQALEHVASDAEQAGQQAGKTFLASLQGTLSNPEIGPFVTAGIVAAVIAASPAIAAAIDSAVLLGIGGGGLVAGLVAAAQDARVKSAWTATIDDIKNKFVDASTPLVKPLVDGADKFGEAFDRYLPGIERGMQRLAPVVDRLIDGAIGFLDRMGPGLGDAFNAALPLLDQVADDLPLLGEYIGEFFDEIAAAGPSTMTFFHDLINLVGFLLDSFGATIEMLSRTYAATSGFAKLMSGDMSGAMDIAHAFGEGTKGSFEKTTEGALHAAQAVDKTTKSLSDFISEALRMQDSQLALQKGLFDIADAFKQNGSSLDINTQKGLANRETMQRQIETIAQWRQEQLDAGKAPAYVNSEVDKQIKLMYDDALAHGANKQQLDGLIGSWRTMLDLPATKNLTTTITTIAQRIDRGSIAAPTGHMRAVRYGGIVRHADAGLITRPGIYAGHGDGTVVMAERETEVEGFYPKKGLSAPDAYGLLSTMASWRGWSIDTGGGSTQPTYSPGGAATAGGSDSRPVQVQLVVDGRVFFEQVVVPYAQQFLLNNGFSGTGG